MRFQANVIASRTITRGFGRFLHYDGTPSSYASNSADYLGDALDPNIETVDLAYDLYEAETKTSNSPLIILHGIFGSGVNHRTAGKILASKLKRDVYSPDLRNFGRSPHIKRLDYPSLAADVERFIENKNLEKPVVIGHSMGGKTAMALALRRPDLLKMLISVDNAPVAFSSTSSTFVKYIGAFKRATENYKFTNIKDVDKELAKVEPNQYIRQFLLTNMNRGKKDDVITSKVPLDIINDALHAGLIASWPYDPSVCRWTKGPALFIRGTESDYVPDEYIPDIGRFFPNFEIRDVKAGHWVISENPKDFVDTVVDFVVKHED
ncbi:hypothetical protein PSN45_005209 [Yamadazyma tenuis]|uniref:Alpha/beta-hydrolase n=1 Tax=Candida tenuis (strain ATCC 10573 / BCRC 21748 / CBS 615 / JCM 9827 / NBRC 10315 / NRRL Y-1498 / VKM Y-70) TaxID=590646 RepID=G3B116_CANTC|nr:alpha/beta-hydrolase [Yamadazyma tenuis ATCC 10573]XP_006685957.1 uncharacterized protein CANTEDRAFT_113623 [Yamadazyma tenuis ATCC 10573]EGV65150.1 alpha/beta-hydrolase [Yamadazyma tenuis ATCC 10573]EGV65151.1 hypothetical protein CANTEDRAFT_113623 [Yamadazyma tenuis ATCC 10573]WEJ97652.1 hypothetical protein PSN45_005209 [Yamadazyma tenuis]